MSVATEAIGQAVTNMATNVYLMSGLLVLVSYQIWGVRLLRDYVEGEKLRSEVEALDKEIAFQGLGGDFSARTASVETSVEDYAGWQSHWEDARGEGDFLVPNDLLGGVMTIQVGAEMVEVVMPETEESNQPATAKDDVDDYYRSFVT